ncbi:MAG: large conductance mechanosensitive channel protein MscL [Candidatus Promineifilaceae bacterium]
MLQEFRDFIAKGNVLDLAVAVILGVAFGAIVLSLTNDIIMPIIGVVLGGVDFTSLAITVGEANIAYGNFIQAVINFVIIAFVIFLLVRAYNNMKAPEAPAADPEDVVLLRQIRDLLQQQQTSMR